MARGRVKWFNDAKGYGFISLDSGEDAFVHYSAIVASGFRSLSSGDLVEVEIELTPKGLQAREVRRLSEGHGVAPIEPNANTPMNQPKSVRARKPRTPLPPDVATLPRTFRPTDTRPPGSRRKHRAEEVKRV